MIAGYTLSISTQSRVMRVHEFRSLDVAVAVNEVGTLKVVLGRAETAGLDLRRDYAILPWVDDAGAMRMEGEAAFLISDIAWGIDTVTVSAVSALDLLNRRVVRYHSTNTSGRYSGPADDLMKNLVLQNIGGSADDTTRNIAGLVVEPSVSLGATDTDKEPAWRNLLQVCQELAKDSEQQGVRIYFDLIPVAGIGYTFKTYRDARGADRTAGAGLLRASVERGTLLSPTLTRAHGSEVNRMYALGQGQGRIRQLGQADDTTLQDNPLALREGVAPSAQATTTTGLVSEARSALKQAAPRATLDGGLADTNAFRYGRHWNLGDVLWADLGTETVKCLVESVRVSVTPDQGRIVTSTLRAL
jgi:hypothetical protein